MHDSTIFGKIKKELPIKGRQFNPEFVLGDSKQVILEEPDWSPLQESKSFADSWGPSFIYSQFDFWDGKDYDVEERDWVYLEDFARNEFSSSEIANVSNSNIMPDSDFDFFKSDLPVSGYFSSVGLSAVNSNHLLGSDIDTNSSDYSILWNDRIYQELNPNTSSDSSDKFLVPNVGLVDFFFRSKNDVSLMVSDSIDSNYRWAVRGNLNFQAGGWGGSISGGAGLQSSDYGQVNNYFLNLISFKLSKYSEIDDNFDFIFKNNFEVIDEGDGEIFYIFNRKVLGLEYYPILKKNLKAIHLSLLDIIDYAKRYYFFYIEY